LAVLKLEPTLPSLFSTLPRILGKRNLVDLAVVGGAPITVHNGADFRPWKVRAVKMATGQGAEQARKTADPRSALWNGV